MDRFLDFNSTPEAVIIARILGQVHKAIDENFPHAASAPSRQFARTLHSPEESTALNRIPMEAATVELSKAESLVQNEPEPELSSHFDPSDDLEIGTDSPSAPASLIPEAIDSAGFEENEGSWKIERSKSRSQWFWAVLFILILAAGIYGITQL